MGRILVIILFIVLVIIVYVGIGQGVHRIDFKKIGPVLFLSTSQSTSTPPKYKWITVTPPPPEIPKPVTFNYSASPSSQSGSSSQPTPPAGYSVSELSPYYGKVHLSYVNPAYYFGASQASIQTDYSLKSAVNVTGWHLKMNRGDVVIPQAVADYQPAGLSSPSDILLSPGNYVVLYGSFSPISSNFRLNECTGYLNNRYNFSPALPNNCPAISRDLISSFTGDCQNYINSLGACSEPSVDALNRFGNSLNLSCQQFLSQLNYGGCYNRYRGDANFLSNEWRVWLGNLPLDFSHDRVLLFDANGLLVDIYKY